MHRDSSGGKPCLHEPHPRPHLPDSRHVHRRHVLEDCWAISHFPGQGYVLRWRGLQQFAGWKVEPGGTVGTGNGQSPPIVTGAMFLRVEWRLLGNFAFAGAGLCACELRWRVLQGGDVGR